MPAAVLEAAGPALSPRRQGLSSRILRRFARAFASFGPGRLVALALLAALLALRVADPPWLEGLRNRVFDTYQQARPRAYAPLPVSIVDIDDASLEQLGQWPWPRTLLADLLRKAGAAGASVVGFDVIFAEPDRLSPARLFPPGSALPAGVPADNDAALAEAMAEVPVVLGRAGAPQQKRAGAAHDLPQTPVALAGAPPGDVLVTYAGLLANLPVLEEAAAGRGLLSFLPDIDGVLRRYPVVSRVGDGLAPSFGLDLLRVATRQDALLLRTDAAGGLAAVRVGPLQAATDRAGRTWIHFTGHRPERFVPAADLISGRMKQDRLLGHVVLVGASATSLSDMKATPLGVTLPGVEIHAQFIETVLSGSALWQPNWALGAELCALALLGLLIVIVLPRLGSVESALLALGLMASLAGGSWWLFAEKRMLIDASLPSASALLIFMVMAIDNYRREEAARRRVRGAFQQYLSPALVEQLAREPERLVLGGENRCMTILFSDVRGFTTLSETFKGDAPGLTRLMNQLLTPLTNAILEREGTIDKYMGDAIMAFWNAPLDVEDHAAHACAAALEMMARLAALNRTLAEEALQAGRQAADIAIGVGINTGDCVVGNMGSDLRFDYTVLGDAVNLASRLEGQSKAYHLNVIIGGVTADLVGERFATLEIDLIKVKGKTQPERIFTLLGGGVLAARPDFQDYRNAVRDLHATIRRQDWEGAFVRLDALAERGRDFGVTGYLAMLRERVEDYRANPPGPGWDGVHVATSK
jgi:adenylate cyclase